MLACSWTKRIYVPDDQIPETPESGLELWFNGGGWAVLGSGIFAAVQALLLALSVFAVCCLETRPFRKSKANAKARAKAKPKPKPKPKVAAKSKSKSKVRTFRLWPKSKAKAKTTERSPLLPQFASSHGKK
jgi:hypothetical protein